MYAHTDTLTMRDACQHVVRNGEGISLTKELEGMELKNEIDNLYSHCLQLVRKLILPFGFYIQNVYQ